METYEKLIIAYDGEALSDGTMDVQELAPALLAIGDLINACNLVLNGKEERIKIKITSDFKKGSFQTSIVVVKDILDQITLLAGPAFELKDILELIGFIGAGVGGLIPLIKKIKSRKIIKAKQQGGGNVEITFEDGSASVITNMNIYNLYTSVPVQDAVNRVVRPLKRDGISNFYTSSKNKRIADISKDEATYFESPNIVISEKEDSLIFEFEYTGAFNIVTAQFEDGYKWRLFNGQDKISASLCDECFSGRVRNGETSISKEDILKAKIKTSQWKRPDGSLRTENEIVEVLEHIKAEKYDQYEIPFED